MSAVKRKFNIYSLSLFVAPKLGTMRIVAKVDGGGLGRG
jgi:hypothetical protein